MKTLDAMDRHLNEDKQDIAARAFHIWEQTGQHHHRDLEYWLEAESKRGATLTHGRPEESYYERFSERTSEHPEEFLAPAW
jgi:hypothetical protein